MIYKQRSKPKQLVIMDILNTRMNLSGKDKNYYLSLKKGYEGEIQFDALTENLQCECIILNDLLLTANHTTFQLDTVIITYDKVYLFEIKNYEVDYYYESEKIYKINHSEIINPLHQLSRCHYLFNQLLHSLGYDVQLDSSVVFINPRFTLYQAPLNQPFIFPTQVRHYIGLLNNIPSKLNRKHTNLAEQLMSLHINESPYKHLPDYNYDQLKKGISCGQCMSFSIYVEGRRCVCKKCRHQESVAAAVLRCVEEFKLLFPNQKVTTNAIHEWCKIIPEKRRIGRILVKHYNRHGTKQWSYYE